MQCATKVFACGLMCLVVATTTSWADAIDALQPVVRLRADDLNGSYNSGDRISSWTDIGTNNPVKTASLNFQYQQVTYPTTNYIPAATNQRPKLIKSVMKKRSVVRFDAADCTWMVAGKGVGEFAIIQNQVWNSTGQTMVAIFSLAAGDTTNNALIHFYTENDMFGDDRAMGIGRLNMPSLQGTTGKLFAADKTAYFDTGYVVPSETPMWVTFTTADGTNLSVYVNGEFKGSMARTPGYAGSPRVITIGGREHWGVMADWLSGDIAEVIIFNRVLNSADMSNLNAFALATYVAPEPQGSLIQIQ